MAASQELPNDSEEDVGERDKTGFLEGAARSDVGGAAAGAGNRAEVVGGAFEFLDEVGTEAAAAVGFADFHVDVAVGAVVMEEDAASRGWLASEFEDVFRAALALFEVTPRVVGRREAADRCALGGKGCRELVVEHDLFALDVLGVRVQHDGEERVVRLHLEEAGFTGDLEGFEEIEGPRAMARFDVELKDRRLARPWSADGDGRIAGDFFAGFEQEGCCPAAAPVDRVVDDLAVHFLAVPLAQRQHGFVGCGSGAHEGGHAGYCSVPGR